ncbi:MAG: prolyl oligopeptidase family serine peptidase [Gemmatimonadota bacterium]
MNGTLARQLGGLPGTVELAGRPDLKATLLYTHGTSDVNASFGAGVLMIDALARTGKTYALMILPDESDAPTGTNGAYRSTAERHFLERHLQP